MTKPQRVQVPAVTQGAQSGSQRQAPSAALGRALRDLYARVPLGMRLGLESMRVACTRAGNPELSFDVVHVAGTNGKGSTCAMIESMARADGTRTGLYTSPHLCRVAERIRIEGVPISDDTLADVLERALEIGPDLSFFETATLAALLAFRDAKVDLAILEVGIGGRLDATNVVPKPRVTAITRIALDHMDRLGNTLEAIAREKAGISKPGVAMVLGPMAPDVRSAALDVALAAGALPIVMGDDRDVVALESLPVALRCAYQQDNARIAARIARELGIGETARREGLAKASWPGRFEQVEVESGTLRGAWLLDGAHNPDGARALALALQDEAARGGTAPGAMVFGALVDKAWPEMLDVLASVAFSSPPGGGAGRGGAPLIYMAPQGRTAAAPAALANHVAGHIATSLPEALRLARATAGDPAIPVVVCGSLCLVGPARALLLDLPTDPPVAL